MRPWRVFAAPLAVGCIAAALTAPWWVTAALAGAAMLVARSPEWRRGARHRVRRSAHGALTVLGVACLAASAPAAAAALDVRADVTANGRLTLSPQTKQVLRALRGDIEVTGFFARGSGEALAFRDLLDQYRRESDRVKVQLFDPDADPGVARRYGLREYGTVFVEYRGRRTETAVVAEIELTSAILRVTRGEPKRACVLEGHGERALDDPTPSGASGLAEALLATNVDLVALDVARTPGDLSRCRLVIVAGPTVALLPDELHALDRWLHDGGKLLAMVDPSSAADFGTLLSAWGIHPDHGVLADPGAAVPGDPATLLVRRFPSENPVGRGLSQLVMPEAAGASLTDDAERGLTTSAVATTSGSAERVASDEGGGGRVDRLDAPAAVAAAADASRVVGSGRSARIERTRVVWIGDSDLATNAFFDLVSNRQLVLNAVNWLLLDEDLIAIGAPSVESRQLLLTPGQRDRLFYTTVVAVPLAIFLAGVAVQLLQRRARSQEAM